MENIILIVITHTSTHDILIATLNRIDKFFPFINYCIATNDKDDLLKNNLYNFKSKFIYEYDNTLIYFSRLKTILEYINYEYILYMHDNNIFVDTINEREFINIINDIKIKNIDQLRLFCAGVPPPNIILDSIISYNITSGIYFSISPTIWRRQVLLDIVYKFPLLKYMNCENNDTQLFVSKFNNYFLFTRNDIPIGGHHLCKLFPFIHITRDGCFAFENNNETQSVYLNEIISEYKLNISKYSITKYVDI